MNDVFMLTGILLMSMVLLFAIFKVIGGFTIPQIDSLYIPPTIKTIFISLIISFIILIPIVKKYGKKGIVAVLLMSVFVYILLIYTNNNDFKPIPPPHLGLDGVALDTQVAGGYIPDNQLN